MSVDGQGTKWRRKIVENLKPLSRVHERYRQTTNKRQTDGRRSLIKTRFISIRLQKPANDSLRLVVCSRLFMLLTLQLSESIARFVSTRTAFDNHKAWRHKLTFGHLLQSTRTVITENILVFEVTRLLKLFRFNYGIMESFGWKVSCKSYLHFL